MASSLLIAPSEDFRTGNLSADSTSGGASSGGSGAGASSGQILQGFGGLLSVFGSQQASRARAKELEDEAYAAEENALLALAAGRYNADRLRIVGEKTLGSIQADYAASGVSSDSISALEVLRESHTAAELDRQNVLFDADMKYQGERRRASAAREGAYNTRMAGDIQTMAGAAQTIFSLIGG